MKKILARYAVAFIALSAFALFVVIFVAYRDRAIANILFQAKTTMLVIPPVFVLLGLLDVWVPREKMIRFMGPGSGFKGSLLGFLLGSFAAGPLYGAFPVAAILMKKGASFMNILIFIGAWSTTKIPMLLFETQALGFRFALSRLCIDILGIVIIAFAVKAAVPKQELDRLYESAAAITD